MGANTAKLFLEIARRPVIAHTWQQFERAACIGEIILVVRAGLQSTFAELAAKYGFKKPFRIVAGGAERQDSVWNGLRALSPQSELVAIHDGARPLVTVEVIQDTLEGAWETGAAVAAQRVTDTIKESEDGQSISRHLDRQRLWAVQTPQAFQVEIIRRAIAAARAKGLSLTDDTAACELIGQPVRLVNCPTPNPKVTVPADLPYVEKLLQAGKAPLKVAR
ncbi:MAG: 2-C-methyl-D-erythritol 4-phosphate cytidylyltransferase [Verrucomicrobia bacterium]|nr:2-C-methyl-D-erythritol 4-phosphate cytidylyltransferase [Verrucomicrobiota bacterium]